MKIEWHDDSGTFGYNGEKAVIGNKWNVGTVFWNGNRPRGDANAWRATCRLPGIKDVVGDFADMDDAKAELEKAVNYWFRVAQSGEEHDQRQDGHHATEQVERESIHLNAPAGSIPLGATLRFAPNANLGNGWLEMVGTHTRTGGDPTNPYDQRHPLTISLNATDAEKIREAGAPEFVLVDKRGDTSKVVTAWTAAKRYARTT